MKRSSPLSLSVNSLFSPSPLPALSLLRPPQNPSLYIFIFMRWTSIMCKLFSSLSLSNDRSNFHGTSTTPSSLFLPSPSSSLFSCLPHHLLLLMGEMEKYLLPLFLYFFPLSLTSSSLLSSLRRFLLVLAFFAIERGEKRE